MRYQTAAEYAPPSTLKNDIKSAFGLLLKRSKTAIGPDEIRRSREWGDAYLSKFATNQRIGDLVRKKHEELLDVINKTNERFRETSTTTGLGGSVGTQPTPTGSIGMVRRREKKPLV